MNHRMVRWSLPVALTMLAFVIGSVFTTESLAQQSDRGDQDAARGRGGTPQESRRVAMRDSAPQQERPDMRSVRVEMTVFLVALAENKLVDLDAKALAASADTPATLHSALETFGKVDTLYRVDQRSRVANRGARVQLSRDVPYVSGMRTDKDGRVLTGVARTDVGTSVNYNVWLDEPGTVAYADVSIELSMITGSSVTTMDDVKSPVFWKARQDYGGSSKLGEPIVILSADGGGTDGSEDVYAYVTLVRFSD
ncbi:MAG: hypothetical protein JXO22_17720 [Phycisphaerae bacterium]|nr:hypothetical protein [Phycisphaerae bacterium]